MANNYYNQFGCHPRLPNFAMPKSYDLKLKPDLTACKFSGTIGIRLEVVSDTKFIVLNSADLQIDSKSVRFQSGSKGFEDVNVELLLEDEVLVLEFGENFPHGAGAH